MSPAWLGTQREITGARIPSATHERWTDMSERSSGLWAPIGGRYTI